MLTCIDIEMLRHLIPLKNKKRKKLIVHTTAYLLRVISASKLNGCVRESMDINPRDFRQALKSSYIAKNLKLWLWWCIRKNASIQQAIKLQQEFEVNHSDIEIYKFFKASPFYQITRSWGSKYRMWDLETFENFTKKVVEENVQYVTKYAYKKLSFLQHSGGLSHVDIIADLNIAGIEGMYTKFPQVESYLHLANIFRSSIKNHGCNMIKFYTTQSRGVLVSELDGTFSSKKISLNAVNSESNSGTLRDDLLEDDIDIEDGVTTSQFFSEVKDPLFRRLLNLLTGSYDKKFSKYLQKRGKKPNDELYDKYHTKGNLNQYIKECSDFLGIPSYDAHVYLSQLRQGVL